MKSIILFLTLIIAASFNDRVSVKKIYSCHTFSISHGNKDCFSGVVLAKNKKDAEVLFFKAVKKHKLYSPKMVFGNHETTITEITEVNIVQ